MTSYIVLSDWDLALASLLILIDAGLSVIFGLHIHRSLLIAAVRMTVQLLLVGLVLTFLFTAVSPLWTGLSALVMILFAGHEVASRQERRLSGWWSYGLGTGCMMASSVMVTAFALLTALRPDPWYDPRYAIPLLGMILGNCMTGIALGLDTLTTGLVNRRGGVEARLMLGATRWQAARPVTRDALRSALMPIVNSMSATGVVSLPGMMTGQILSGVPPAEAVKYQILVMFLIAGGTGFGAVAAVIGGVYRLTDRRHRLRLDRPAVALTSNGARRFGLTLALVLVAPEMASAEAPLTLDRRIPLGNVSGRIDHLAVDLRRQRLFIAELGNDSVSAVDLPAGKVQSRVTGMREPQGVGYEPSTDAVYVANGGDGSLRILRGEDMTPLARIDLGADADNVRIEPLRRHVVVGHGSGALAVIDPDRRAKIGDVPLKAHPEAFQISADGARAFVNVPDAGLIEFVDLIKGESVGTLPTLGHRGNFPMALDNSTRQLATVFRRPARVIVTDTGDQKLLADLETCGDADDVFFDLKRRRLYVVCGEGVIDVFAANGAGFVRAGQVATASGARTGLFVPELDRLFVAARAGWTEPAALLVFRPAD